MPHHLRAQTGDNVDNWSDWTPLFSLQYDGQPPIITDTVPANGSVITTAWPVISTTLTDPEPGSGVQPLSTTLLLDSQVVTPQVNTASGVAYTPSVRLTDGVHSVAAQVYDQAGNQTQSGPWSFTVDDDSAPSLGVTKYYFHGDLRIAMRQDDVVYFIHADHLGSTSLTTDITGTVVAETRYLPYGEERWITGSLVTDFTFTGQRAERGFGLLDYNARYYDPWLGRFVSADTVVPEAGNPQALNRYAYVYNNPLRYTDPDGHRVALDPDSQITMAQLDDDWVFVETPPALLTDWERRYANYVLTENPGFFPGEGHPLMGPTMDYTLAILNEMGFTDYTPSAEGWQRAVWDAFARDPDAFFAAGLAAMAIIRDAQDAVTTPRGGISSGPIHKNSLDYVGETHVYRIVGPDGTTYKIGQSAQGVRGRDSASIRAEQQVRKLIRKTRQPYRSEIRRVFPGKRSAREYETRLIERFRRIYGENTLPGNLTNR